MRVGIVACGYADGYPRHAPTGTPILVGGQRTRTIGRVSMDMLACDLTDMPEAGVGSARSTFWGEGLPADEVAAQPARSAMSCSARWRRRVPVDRGLSDGQSRKPSMSCTECGATVAEMAGAVPRLRCLEHAGRNGRRERVARHAVSQRLAARRACRPCPRSRRAKKSGSADRYRRVRPGAWAAAWSPVASC